MKPLDADTVALSGTQLVEASAGTGKTYTITTLFTRLLTEAQLGIDQILVVTYTRAATAELKDRMRGRLLDRLKQPLDADDRERLQAALHNLDDASVLTIHGFCQRALAEHAFESGAAFDAEMLPHTQGLLQEIVDDFWALQTYEAREELARALRPERAGLLGLAARLCVDPEVRRTPPQATVRAPDRERWQQAWQRAAASWHEGRTAVLTLLSEAGLGLQKRWLSGWAEQMDEAMGQPDPGRTRDFDKAERFTHSWLQNRAADKGKLAPQHPFFEDCEQWWEADQQVVQYQRALALQLRHALADYTRREWIERTRERGTLTFDDLLRQLRDALRGQEGDALTRRLRARYRAVLIDEFQDTDPLQYGIFRQLFAGREQPLLLIGDPKQAIYGFRGADVFAYMTARADAGERSYTLATNYRSDPSMVAAVNHVFGRQSKPLLLDGIDYHQVQARPGAVDALSGDDSAALEVLFVEPGDGARQNKASLERELPARIASHVVALLSGPARLAREGSGTVAQQGPVKPADVAVLCRTNAQAALVQRALSARGVPAVLHGDSSVFDSDDAVQLERLLSALARPTDARAVRSALCTWYLGCDAQQLSDLELDDAAWDEHRSLFGRMHQRWAEQGFYAAMRGLMRQCGIEARLLARPDGARRLTNFNHLLELLQQAAVSQRLGPLGLLHWLSTMRADLAQRAELVGESAQIRLESSADAVTLTTVHRSKGLEYPIVVCPFLWDGRVLSGEDARWLRFHDPEHAHAATLHLDASDAEREKELASKEALAENLRLLYVALTRAKHRASVVWGDLTGSDKSALGYLLHGSGPPSSRAAGIKSADAASLREQLLELAARSEGSMTVRDLTVARDDRYEPLRTEARQLKALRVRRKLDQGQRTSSFSALTAGDHNEPGADHDAHVSAVEQTPTRSPRVRLSEFPAGPQVGQLFHDVLERHDFRAGEDAMLGLAEQLVLQHGLQQAHVQPLVAGLLDVLATPLDGHGLTLQQLATEQRLNEMEFIFPVDGAQPLTPQRLAATFRQHAAPATSPSYARALAGLDFAALAGFMRGFIDLVFVHEGRWYVVDYKSNRLGTDVAHYAPPRLLGAMAEHHYHLQYTLYTLALHRYLQWRVPGYDYEQHFGGVYYLFLRGMAPEHPAQTGVFFERPSLALIQALGAFMAQPQQSPEHAR